jgi:hypothetical protein
MEATDYAAAHGGPLRRRHLDATAVLVKYTYYGDTDFNGTVNFDDYVRTDSGFNNHLSSWLNGDFDGNGAVNFDDYCAHRPRVQYARSAPSDPWQTDQRTRSTFGVSGPITSTCIDVWLPVPSGSGFGAGRLFLSFASALRLYCSRATIRA